MSVITLLASRIWLFFSYVGTLCQQKVADVVNGITISVNNPFNADVWNVETGQTIISDAINAILENYISSDVTVLDCMLILTCVVFFVGFVTRIVTGIFD